LRAEPHGVGYGLDCVVAIFLHIEDATLGDYHAVLIDFGAEVAAIFVVYHLREVAGVVAGDVGEGVDGEVGVAYQLLFSAMAMIGS